MRGLLKSWKPSRREFAISSGAIALSAILDQSPLLRAQSASANTNPEPARVQKVIIDTDPGVDDAFALLLALRSPELKIEAITAVAGIDPLI